VSKLIDEFRALSPASRRLFLAQMAVNSPELRDLQILLEELHETLVEIHGDDYSDD
jgi:hypothetical protein